MVDIKLYKLYLSFNNRIDLNKLDNNYAITLIVTGLYKCL